MITYDKHEVREKLTQNDIFELLTEWGGDPSIETWGILSTTICHNPPGEGSRKLYYYANTDLFTCYTGGCEEHTFDIFQLFQKVAHIQWNKEYDLNDAVRYIAIKFGIAGYADLSEQDTLIDWKTFDSYERIKDLELKDYHAELKEYDMTVLKNLNYTVRIKPWEDEGITREVMQNAVIGYFPPTA